MQLNQVRRHPRPRVHTRPRSIRFGADSSRTVEKPPCRYSTDSSGASFRTPPRSSWLASPFEARPRRLRAGRLWTTPRAGHESRCVSREETPRGAALSQPQMVHISKSIGAKYDSFLSVNALQSIRHQCLSATPRWGIPICTTSISRREPSRARRAAMDPLLAKRSKKPCFQTARVNSATGAANRGGISAASARRPTYVWSSAGIITVYLSFLLDFVSDAGDADVASLARVRSRGCSGPVARYSSGRGSWAELVRQLGADATRLLQPLRFRRQLRRCGAPQRCAGRRVRGRSILPDGQGDEWAEAVQLQPLGHGDSIRRPSRDRGGALNSELGPPDQTCVAPPVQAAGFADGDRETMADANIAEVSALFRDATLPAFEGCLYGIAERVVRLPRPNFGARRSARCSKV